MRLLLCYLSICFDLVMIVCVFMVGVMLTCVCVVVCLDWV